LAEKTGARLDTVDIADGSGWQVDSTHELDVFTKGAVTIEVRYSVNDDVESAVKQCANGDFDTIAEHTAAKVDRLRSWLTGRNDDQEQARAAITAGPTPERSQRRWEFFEKFLNRVGAEHPDWTSRKASTYETLLTLPTGASKAVFQVGFTRGGLVFEVLFKDPDPTVNLARFTALHTRKDQFEQALGEEARWDEMAGSKATRVYVISALGDVEDVDQWPAMIDWLLDQYVRFRRAIQAFGGVGSLA
jgi:hypothetical protein